MLSEDNPLDLLLAFVDNHIVAELPGGEGIIDGFVALVEAALGGGGPPPDGPPHGGSGGSSGDGVGWSSLGSGEAESGGSEPGHHGRDGGRDDGVALAYTLLGDLAAGLDL
jgi:hypothetical protein